MYEKEKKILSKFEWFLLSVALGILALVLLQNKGVNVIETTETIEISEAEKNVKAKENTQLSFSKSSSDHINDLSDYFSKNRADAKAAGKDLNFDWNNLKLPDDETKYLKNKYGDKADESSSTDWFAIISKSHKTYKSVKSVFNDLGIDTDKLINAENASKAFANPIIANSIYNKMEEDFGIPAEKSRSFAEKHQKNLDDWAKFVEKEIQ